MLQQVVTDTEAKLMDATYGDAVVVDTKEDERGLLVVVLECRCGTHFEVGVKKLNRLGSCRHETSQRS